MKRFLLLMFCFLSMFKICYSKDKEREFITRNDILSQKEIPVYGYRVVKEYFHDADNYTEGLLMDGGCFIYEGTGLYGHTYIIKTDLETGKIVLKKKVDNKYFGEGATILGDNFYQLTYISNTGFIYDKNTFELKGEFYYSTQGWGLTTDGKSLIMSDGSSAIHFLDSNTLKEKKYILVSDGNRKIGFINEMEYINGKIYANIWQTDFIVVISPDSGKVDAWIDLTGINPNAGDDSFVLNGIAFNEKTKNLLVTGKCWPKIYEIQLISK